MTNIRIDALQDSTLSLGDHEENLSPLEIFSPNETTAPITTQHTTDSPQEASRILHAYLVAVILVNFSLLFLKGYSADLGYWADWIKQLSSNGYHNFNGNYPPFYIHWLYFLGNFYDFIHIPLETNNFLKFLTQLPVMLSHCLLTVIIFSLLNRFNAQGYLLHAIMILTVFNPAILVNGPIWGQVDLIPVTLIIGAILLNFHARFSYFAIPLFMLALLTKFQMITFAPVFGFLFFRNIKKNILGIMISLAVIPIIFMPSIIAGHFIQAFKLAYIDTLGQYPMTTFNAANIWILLTSNTAPDNQILFGVPESSAAAKIFTAKYFGMLLFVVAALWLFLQGTYRTLKNRFEQVKNSTTENIQTSLAHTLFSSMLCAMAFFTLLPAMHERYLFPAAAMALAYVAVAQQKLIYPIIISMLCSLNMFIILEVNGSDIWHGLAWLMVSILGLGLLETIFGDAFFNRLKSIVFFIYRIPVLSIWVFLIALSVMFFSFYNNYRIHSITPKENEMFLTSLQLIYATQDHGNMKINRSHDDNVLSLSNQRYAQGIGTHSNSDIQFQLPENATEFSFMAGLDDEVGFADVQFSVWGDEKLLWQSNNYYGHEHNVEVFKVDIHGVKKINLKVAALKDDKWDHADWVNTLITVSKK